MTTSKSLTAGIAAAALVGVIGLAYAQTSDNGAAQQGSGAAQQSSGAAAMDPQTPATQAAPSDTSAATPAAPATSTTPSTTDSSSTPAPSSEPPAKADRN